MDTEGKIITSIESGIGTVSFSHPRGNSLPGKLLKDIADAIASIGKQDNARVLVLKSEGAKAFCGGASFDELLSIGSKEKGQEFFIGFAEVILAIRNCPKFVIARVQGKTVGGGVGIIAACDYAIATEQASVRLSELALGFGPFVISAAVERKVGISAFQALTIDTEWREPAWGLAHGLYSKVVSDIPALDKAILDLGLKLSGFSPQAMARLKSIFWEGTENWDKILNQRASSSAELVLTEMAQKAIRGI